MTTSGTAVAELLPAVVEAHYSALPLVLITADRPPQTEQAGIRSVRATIESRRNLHINIESTSRASFGAYAATSLDSRGTAPSPLHINIEFDEPLIDE